MPTTSRITTYHFSELGASARIKAIRAIKASAKVADLTKFAIKRHADYLGFPLSNVRVLRRYNQHFLALDGELTKEQLLGLRPKLSYLGDIFSPGFCDALRTFADELEAWLPKVETFTVLIEHYEHGDPILEPDCTWTPLEVPDDVHDALNTITDKVHDILGFSEFYTEMSDFADECVRKRIPDAYCEAFLLDRGDTYLKDGTPVLLAK